MGVLCATGVAGVYSALVSPAGAVILMYHSIAGADATGSIDPDNRMDPAEFERQMSFLASHRTVVSMDRVADAVRGRADLAPGSVAITFDDGYMDNLTVAAPVLARLGLPATLYLPTSYIDTGATQWIDRLHCAFRTRSAQRIEGAVIGSAPMNLGSPGDEQRAYEMLKAALRRAHPTERELLLASVESQLGTTPPSTRLTMTWSDVRVLLREFPAFSIGGHTRSHADLGDTSATHTEDEIVGCFEAIERHTGVRARHFSFPYGRWSSVGAEVLKREGAASGVASGSLPRARQGVDVMRLSRVAAPGSVGDLRALTHPAYPDLPFTLLGRT